MFKVGRRYEFKMIIDGDESTFWRHVRSYEHPLIGVDSNLDGEIDIINVTSPNFISADIEPEG